MGQGSWDSSVLSFTQLSWGKNMVIGAELHNEELRIFLYLYHGCNVIMYKACVAWPASPCQGERLEPHFSYEPYCRLESYSYVASECKLQV